MSERELHRIEVLSEVVEGRRALASAAIVLSRLGRLPAKTSLPPDIGDHLFDFIRAAMLEATRQCYRKGVAIQPGRPHLLRSIGLPVDFAHEFIVILSCISPHGRVQWVDLIRMAQRTWSLLAFVPDSVSISILRVEMAQRALFLTNWQPCAHHPPFYENTRSRLTQSDLEHSFCRAGENLRCCSL
jgi:hypothetical protein